MNINSVQKRCKFPSWFTWFFSNNALTNQGAAQKPELHPDIIFVFAAVIYPEPLKVSQWYNKQAEQAEESQNRDNHCFKMQ